MPKLGVRTFVVTSRCPPLISAYEGVVDYIAFWYCDKEPGPMIETSDGKVVALDLSPQLGRVPMLSEKSHFWRREAGLFASGLGPQPFPLGSPTGVPMSAACVAEAQADARDGAIDVNRANGSTLTNPKGLCTVCRWSLGLLATHPARRTQRDARAEGLRDEQPDGTGLHYQP